MMILEIIIMTWLSGRRPVCCCSRFCGARAVSWYYCTQPRTLAATAVVVRYFEIIAFLLAYCLYLQHSSCSYCLACFSMAMAVQGPSPPPSQETTSTAGNWKSTLSGFLSLWYLNCHQLSKKDSYFLLLTIGKFFLSIVAARCCCMDIPQQETEMDINLLYLI